MTSVVLAAVSLGVGSELSMDPREVFDLVVKSNGADEKLGPYAEELLEAVRKVNSVEERRKFVMASCLITNRIDPKWEIADTMAMHPDLVEELATLYIEEENKSIEALVAASEAEGSEGEGEKPELGKD